LQEADQNPEIRVMIVRGAGTCFSSGYDLDTGNEGQELPWFTPGGEGQFPRQVTQGWMSIWELAKPVIAEVHGYCLAGGAELATCCDLVYMADDAQTGCPAVRFGVPDTHFHAWLVGMRKAMEMMVTGDSISGVEAARLGWANASFPAQDLEQEVLRVAQRIATLPPDAWAPTCARSGCIRKACKSSWRRSRRRGSRGPYRVATSPSATTALRTPRPRTERGPGATLGSGSQPPRRTSSYVDARAPSAATVAATLKTV
ncbi:MAG: enoyl-CoA hydratase/isomerase family protein, partial [Deltaproteobacteria bacterium]|nr:enoyl-CoA hydratase/isomerase family protein [Deltaproteobacteria bacterium]